jgi:hypothetical protein
MSLYKNFETREGLRSAIALARKTSIKGEDGKAKSNHAHDVFWSLNVIPGVYGIFAATAALGPDIRGAVVTSGKFMSFHQEIAEGEEGFSELFLSQSPVGFLRNADTTLVQCLGIDGVLNARALAMRASGLPSVSKASFVPAVFEIIQPGIEELLTQGYNRQDLSGDRLALMYRGPVR